MFDWFTCLPDGTVTGELKARDKKVTWRLDGAGEAEFTLINQTVDPLVTDVLVTYKRSSQYGWRGRCGPSGWDIDEQSHTEQWSAVDYRGVLSRWPALEDLSYTNTEEQIIRALLAHVRTGPSGASLGVGIGSLGSGATRTVEVPVGKSFAEQVDDLAGMWPGFHWWVSPDMTVEVARPRGSFREFPLELPTTCSKVSGAFDPASYGNAIIQTGADTTTPVVKYAADLASRPEGRWMLVASNPDITSQPALNDAATRGLAKGTASGVSHTFTLRPGVWSPEQAWLGDLVPYRYRSGGRDVDSIEQITEITVSDDGNQTQAQITVGSTLAGNVAALRRVNARLNQLARR